MLDEFLENPGSRKLTILGFNRRGVELEIVVNDSEEAEKLKKLCIARCIVIWAAVEWV